MTFTFCSNPKCELAEECGKHWLNYPSKVQKHAIYIQPNEKDCKKFIEFTKGDINDS
jgi:hypothetical protein